MVPAPQEVGVRRYSFPRDPQLPKDAYRMAPQKLVPVDESFSVGGGGLIGARKGNACSPGSIKNVLWGFHRDGTSRYPDWKESRGREEGVSDMGTATRCPQGLCGMPSDTLLLRPQLTLQLPCSLGHQPFSSQTGVNMRRVPQSPSAWPAAPPRGQVHRAGAVSRSPTSYHMCQLFSASIFSPIK